MKKKSKSAKTHSAVGQTKLSRKAADVETGAADQHASDRFKDDLLVRQEAVKPPAQGQKLPPQATHVITKENEDGSAEVERVRFKFV
jgi:hypothetical protein